MAAQLFMDDPRPEMAALVDDATMHEALTTLGADPMTALTEEEREHLLTQGFLYVPMPGWWGGVDECPGFTSRHLTANPVPRLLEGIMTPEQCEEAKRRIHDQIASENPGEPFSVGSEGDDALRLSNVFNKQNPDGLFDAPVTHPRVLACMRLMLGDSFKLSSLNFRGANPGSGLQGLHTGARSGSRLFPSVSEF